MKFDAVGLFVTDMAIMAHFYRDVLGMRTDWNGAVNAELYSSEMRLLMFGRDDFEKMTSRKYTYPTDQNGTLELSFSLLKYEDVDQEYERVVKAGATPVFPPTDEPWGQRTSYVSDPDGNLIEISSFNLES